MVTAAGLSAKVFVGTASAHASRIFAQNLYRLNQGIGRPFYMAENLSEGQTNLLNLSETYCIVPDYENAHGPDHRQRGARAAWGQPLEDVPALRLWHVAP